VPRGGQFSHFCKSHPLEEPCALWCTRKRLEEEITNRKILPLQTMLGHSGHNDLLCDIRHNSSVAVTKFILLISRHLSDRIVSDVKQSPCWSSMVDETTDIAALCCSFYLPQPGQSEGLQFCALWKPSKETACCKFECSDKCFNQRSRQKHRQKVIIGLCVCAGGLIF